MSYNLLLSLILTFVCGDIIGQTISGIVTNELHQSIDTVSVVSNSSNNKTLVLELEEIGLVKKNTILSPSLMFPSTLSLENSFSHGDFKQLPYLNLVGGPRKDKPFYHSRIIPFNYNFENGIEGFDLVGFDINVLSTPVVSFFVSPRITSSYMGPLFPERINNASLHAKLLVNAGDNVRFKFEGQISAYQGINPLLNPMVGASNYYGGAIQVRVFGDFGLEASVQRSFYMGRWDTSYRFSPVSYSR